MERFSVRPEAAVENLHDDLPEDEESSSTRPAGEYQGGKTLETADNLTELLRARGRDNYKQAWQVIKEAEREGLDLSNSAELAGAIKEAMLSEMRDGNFRDLRWLGAALGAKLWSLGSGISDNPEWQAAAADGVTKALDQLDASREKLETMQLELDSLKEKSQQREDLPHEEEAMMLDLEQRVWDQGKATTHLRDRLDELNGATEFVAMAEKTDPKIAARIEKVTAELMQKGKVFAEWMERNKDRLGKIRPTRFMRSEDGSLYTEEDGLGIIEQNKEE